MYLNQTYEWLSYINDFIDAGRLLRYSPVTLENVYDVLSYAIIGTILLSILIIWRLVARQRRALFNVQNLYESLLADTKQVREQKTQFQNQYEKIVKRSKQLQQALFDAEKRYNELDDAVVRLRDAERCKYDHLLAKYKTVKEILVRYRDDQSLVVYNNLKTHQK